MGRPIPRVWIPVVVVVVTLLGTVHHAAADPIRIAPFVTSAFYPISGSLADFDGDGVAESGSYYMVTSNSGPGAAETRGFAEYDVRGLRSSQVRRAWYEAQVEPPLRGRAVLIAGSMYSANGRFDLSDYSIAATRIGTFTVASGLQPLFITLPVTGALRDLLNSGADFAGFRFQALHKGDWALIGGHAGEFTRLVVETTPTPEPGTMLLFGIGLALAGLRRSLGKA